MKTYVVEFKNSDRIRILACKHEIKDSVLLLSNDSGEQVAEFRHYQSWWLDEAIAEKKTIEVRFVRPEDEDPEGKLPELPSAEVLLTAADQIRPTK